jgi:PAS domain-containing protein
MDDPQNHPRSGTEGAAAQTASVTRSFDELLRAVMEQPVVGVVQLEAITGRFVRVNQHYCDFVGYSPEELETMDFRSVTYPGMWRSIGKTCNAW